MHVVGIIDILELPDCDVTGLSTGIGDESRMAIRFIDCRFRRLDYS